MVKSETHRDPSVKIRARDDEDKNPRPRCKKYMHAKTRFRDSAQRLSRSDENLPRPRIFKRPFATPTITCLMFMENVHKTIVVGLIIMIIVC